MAGFAIKDITDSGTDGILKISVLLLKKIIDQKFF
jgi:hypothetical protein